jgi:hypothetical protein
MRHRCIKHFDASVTGPPQKSAPAAMMSYGVDTNWFIDSRATDHVTSKLDKLTIRDKYGGHDQVHSASGTGMRISYIRSSILHTPTSNIHLDKILHVPQASKSLFQFIVLRVIIMLFLSSTPINFSTRNRVQRRHSYEAHVKEVFIP